MGRQARIREAEMLRDESEHEEALDAVAPGAFADWRAQRDAELDEIVDAALALEGRLLAERDAEIKRLRERVEVADAAAAKAQKYMNAINDAAETERQQRSADIDRLHKSILSQEAEIVALQRARFASRVPWFLAICAAFLAGLVVAAVGAVLTIPLE